MMNLERTKINTRVTITIISSDLATTAPEEHIFCLVVFSSVIGMNEKRILWQNDQIINSVSHFI